MWHFANRSLFLKVSSFALVLMASSAMASYGDPQCPDDVCITGFKEAQGGVVVMEVRSSSFIPGVISCRLTNSDETLTFFDAKKNHAVTTSFIGDSRRGIQDCIKKTPHGTSGIEVHQCVTSTQFSAVDEEHILRRQQLVLTVTYPFLGPAYSSAELTQLVRDDNQNLVSGRKQLFGPDMLSCESENTPKTLME